jgi:hypothetical protein
MAFLLLLVPSEPKDTSLPSLARQQAGCLIIRDCGTGAVCAVVLATAATKVLCPRILAGILRRIWPGSQAAICESSNDCDHTEFHFFHLKVLIYLNRSHSGKHAPRGHTKRDPLNREARSQLRRTVSGRDGRRWRRNSRKESSGDATRALGKCICDQNKHLRGGRLHRAVRRRQPCESCETVPQRRSGVGRIEQFDTGKGWVLAVCDFLPGQQMWRVREGSGKAGEAPACTTAAAEGACQYTLSLVG